MFKNSKLFFWTIELFAVLGVIWISTHIGFVFKPVTTLFSLVFLPFIIAGFLYYVFNPLVMFLEEKLKLPRIWGIVLVFVLLIGLLTYTVISLVPRVITQLSDLIIASGSIVPELQKWVDKLSANPAFKEIDFKTLINKANISYMDILQNLLSGVTFSLSNVVNAIFKVAMILSLVPILLFYMLKDGKNMLPFLKKTLLKRDKLNIISLLDDMNTTISKYISGAAIDCLFIFVTVFIAYLIIGVPYAFLFAAFSAITNLIPYLGPYIGLIPVLFSIGFTDPVRALIAALVVLTLQQIDGNIIYPKVVGSAIEVHPVTIMVLMLVTGSLYGLIGMLVAVPFYSLAKEVVKFLWRLWENHKLVQLGGDGKEKYDIIEK
ncbi:AI-2E family transporter [Lactococcus piscium]|uniref:AI-2E family transporter n=1 Tax=Pseudolactococcus paracarnosus TaxID=2749962 RepID=A0A7L4WHH1_9LACT|nr:AI-2E family transporter [Lactococcus paracarnosus]MCJ1993443.1 AI-2E family transporter [Lactococcus paracarnosus]QDJ28810.1 AI-2E family transporter [Lactococcus paracarnosus]SPC37426.1 Permease [Lactococcus piscium]